MKKRLLSLLLVLVLLLGLLPSAALAADSATVDFTAQAAGAFLCAPQFNVKVDSDLAESYGYTDKVTDGVSALDVLVKAHEVMYANAFTSETKDNYLVVSNGTVSKLFTTDTYANGFILNGMYPHDGTNSPYGGYNGTTVDTQTVTDGDLVEFFLYQDNSYYSDEVAWFCHNGNAINSLTVRPGATVSMTFKGTMYMGGYLYQDVAAMHEAGTPIEAAQLAWVDISTGTVTDISGAVTSNSGNVSLTMPTEEKTYYLTAYIPADEIENNYASPLVMSLLKVTVDVNAPELDEPTGSCDLTALSVGDLNSNPNSLILKPVFSSDVTAYSVDTVAFQQYAKMAYVKATAASGTAIIKATLNGTEKTVTSGDSYWTSFNNMLPGQDNILTVKVAASDAEDAETKTYTVIIPMAPNPNAPTLKGEASGAANIRLDESYDLDLSTVFTDADNAEELTYKVSVNDAEAVNAESDYKFYPAAAGIYTLVFVANDGKDNSPAYTVTLTVTTPDTSITVPSDATVYVGRKDYKATYNYQPFTQVNPAFTKDNGDGTTTYYYDIESNKYCVYRIGGTDYVTFVGQFTKKADAQNLTVTKEQLECGGKTKTTVDHDVNSLSGRNVADVYLNINPQNYLKLNVGGTKQLIPLRNWQIIESSSNSFFVEPDYHYTILNEDLTTADTSIISIDENGLITANGAGTVIVLVTYDAMYNNYSGWSNGFNSAIWPENTGVFVVSVGAEDSGITTGMTINAGRNTTGNKLSGDAIDAEHDVIYFTGETGSYTFTPGTDGCTVTVANPTVADTMTFSTFTAASVNNDGSVTVPLTEGRNIVKLEKEGKAEYQVITAKKISYTINDGQPITAGSEISIVFDKIYHPANKLAGIYNSNAGIAYTTPDGKMAGSISNSAYGVYNIASLKSAQTVDSLRSLQTTATSWGTNTSFVAGDKLTIPENWTENTYSLTGGTLSLIGFGDPFGNHRAVTYENGKDANMTANQHVAYLGQMPDIEIPVTTLQSIAVTVQPTKTTYNIGTQFDPAGMEITANYANGQSVVVKDYTVGEVSFTKAGEAQIPISYTDGGKTVSCTTAVTVTDVTLERIEITTPPSKTEYLTHNSFDPTGMVVTAYYSDGSSDEVTDYTVPSEKLNTVGEQVEVTITYASKTATQKVAVSANTLSSISLLTGPNKTKYIVGEYFDPSGTSVTAKYADGSTDIITDDLIFRMNLSTTSTAYTAQTQWTSGAKTKNIFVHYSENGENKRSAKSFAISIQDLTNLEVTNAPTKTNYTVGDYFDPSGIQVTATFTDGSTENVTNKVAYSDNYFTEATDSHAVTVSYSFGADPEMLTTKTAFVSCTVAEAPPVDPDQPEIKDITVSFTLLGDSKHGEPTGKEDTHTLKASNLETWISKTSITVPENSKVIDVMVKALGLAGIPYENPTGNYVSSIRGLSEFDNGTNSGWMYTLNDIHPTLGVNEQTVKNGDVIVFHYTDDYTVEQGSEYWGGSSSNSGSSTANTSGAVIKPEATADKNGEASAEVSSKEVSAAMEQAKKDNADAIVIKPDIKGDASKVTVELSTASIDSIAANSTLGLTVSTPVADMTISNVGLAELGMQNGSTVSFSTEKVKVAGSDAVRVEITENGRAMENVAGGVTIGITGDGNAMVLVNADGTETIIKKSAVDKDGGHVAVLPGSATVKLIDNTKSFTDVTDAHWASDAIDFVTARELFNGTGDEIFSPAEAMTRGMLVTVLYRMEDAAVESGNRFLDVTEGSWYADAAAWASANGIVDGVDDNNFAPERNITREELATMMYRYAAFVKMDTAASGSLSRFSDGIEVSDYAKEAMEWAVGVGLLDGKENDVLDPKGSAARAEAAAVMQRMITLMVK
ncbi:MAG: bacterial Ig-like domain-containing protein [Clostridiales bacterium]|nr:bacterial Ig-like domain-containing protein [Clostridiales bacterium]